MYTEQLVITKDLDLHGAGESATVIQSPSTLTPFGLNLRNGRPVAAVVRIGHGAHVRISGLGVRGPLPCALATGVVATQSAPSD